MLRSAKELSAYIHEKVMEDSLTGDEVKTLFGRLEEIESELLSSPDRLKHLPFTDKKALGRYIQKRTTRIHQFELKLLNDQEKTCRQG